MKKKNRIWLYLLLNMGLLCMLMSSCKKDNSTSQNKIQNVIGYAQKGPFINGSSVTVYDLQSDLSPTGKSFNSQITDNKGTFRLSDISLSSNYVSLRADGFYFNEVLGEQSVAQITLYALSDISGKSNININLLTHLEKSRVQYLMKNGKSFADAKLQAQKEILAIFNIQKNDSISSESLNIAESGDDNGILLAISAISQGFRSESELTGLLSNISEDISTDGVLSSDKLGSALITHAVYLDTVSIKNNLTQMYTAIGSQSNIPNFGKYIANFISQTKFKITNPLIIYPSKGIYGDNILALTDTVYINTDWPNATTNFSLAATMPKGISLTIKITVLSEHTVFGYLSGSSVNWAITIFYDEYNRFSQTYTTIESGKPCDLSMSFTNGEFLVEYYEMNANSPTRKKIITVK